MTFLFYRFSARLIIFSGFYSKFSTVLYTFDVSLNHIFDRELVGFCTLGNRSILVSSILRKSYQYCLLVSTELWCCIREQKLSIILFVFVVSMNFEILFHYSWMAFAVYVIVSSSGIGSGLLFSWDNKVASVLVCSAILFLAIRWCEF